MRLPYWIILLVALIHSASPIAAQKNTIGAQAPRIDPPDWWTDMKDNKLQLCIYGKDISQYSVSTDYPGFKITKVNKVENPNYLFVDIVMD